MANDQVEWVVIKDNRLDGREVGALAYSGGDIAAVVAYHEPRDFNQDGTVTTGEKARAFIPLFGNENQVMASVLRAAYEDPNILVRGGGIRQLYGRAFTQLGFSLISEGVYLAYFQSPVSAISGSIAKQITSGMVKQMIVKQAFSSLFKQGYKAVTP